MRGRVPAFVQLVLIVALAIAITNSESSAAATPAKKTLATMSYVTREAHAPQQVRTRLATLRSEVTKQHLTFHIGYTTAMDRSLDHLAATRAPADLEAQSRRQNELAQRLLEADQAARDSLHKARPHLKIPDFVPSICTATWASFDWRRRGKVTPVRDQGGCGSCWDFAALGAYEGAYAIRNNVMLDASEQYVLSCSSSGSCGGGWHAGVFNYLITTGITNETTDPYSATDTPCPTGMPHALRAVAWGYVDPNGGIPSVAAMKQALCTYGPLTVAVLATPLFQAYTGGVFDEHDTTHGINHDVTLIGWDDGRHAWIIKNSWGPGWGNACGFGTGRGYMWIDYASNNIGTGAAWVMARSRFVIPLRPFYTLMPNMTP